MLSSSHDFPVGATSLLAFLVVVWLHVSTAAAEAACPTWQGAHQLYLTTGSVTTLTPPGCTYTNLNITVYCEPQSTLIISHLTLNGGYIAIVGPANAASPGNLSDVSIQVYDSTITADLGPAVGVIIGFSPYVTVGTPSPNEPRMGLRAPYNGYDTGPANVARNVSLHAARSTLTSTSSNGAMVLSITVDPKVAASSLTLLSGVSITAVDCTLAATADTVASAAGVSLGEAYLLFTNFAADDMRISLTRTTASATGQCSRGATISSAVANAGGIALPVMVGFVKLTNVAFYAESSNLTASASTSGQCLSDTIAASAGVAVGSVLSDRVAFANVNASAVNSSVASIASSFLVNPSTNHVAASVGFATSYLTAPSYFADVNFFAVLSNTTSHASFASPKHSNKYTRNIRLTPVATSVGIALGDADYLVSFTGVSLAVLRGTAASHASLAADTWLSIAVASVAGSAIGLSRRGVTMTDCFFYSATDNTNADAAANGGPSLVAAAVAAHVEAGQTSSLTPAVARSRIASSSFVVANGSATVSSTVFVSRWSVATARSFATVGGITAYVLPVVGTVLTAVSNATAVASASAVQKGSRRDQGDAVVGRVENATRFPVPDMKQKDSVTQASVTVHSFPPCLRPWLYLVLSAAPLPTTATSAPPMITNTSSSTIIASSAAPATTTVPSSAVTATPRLTTLAPKPVSPSPPAAPPPTTPTVTTPTSTTSPLPTSAAWTPAPSPTPTRRGSTPTRTTWGTPSPAPTPTPPTMPPGLLTQSAAATNQEAVWLAAAVATALACPAAAFQASRALSVISLSQCNFDVEGSVDFPDSMWPGFAIESGRRGAYLRGGVVAALGTVLAFAIIGALAVVAFGATLGNFVVRGPGVITVPVGVTLDGLVTCAVAALIHGDFNVARALDTALALVATLYVAGVTALAVLGGRRLPAAADFQPTSRIDAFMRGGPSRYGTLSRRDPSSALPHFQAPPPRALHLAFGSVFTKYTVERRWFYAVDLWLAVFVSVAKGTMPTTLHGCYIATGVVTALCGVMALLAVITRPHVSPAQNSLLVASSVLTFAAAVLVFVAMALYTSALLKGGQILALVSGYVSIASVGVSVYGAVVASRPRVVESAVENDDVEADDSTVMMPRTVRTIDDTEQSHDSTLASNGSSFTSPPPPDSINGPTTAAIMNSPPTPMLSATSADHEVAPLSPPR